MKLTKKDVRVIRKLSRDGRVPQSYIGVCYNITQAMVSYIKNNRRHQGVQ
jgi:DNA-binding Lrp family transcriptional regulator